MIDLSTLTLADVEELAARLSSAAKVIRDAQAMLGGHAPAPAEAINFTPRVVTNSAPHPMLTPAEIQERDRLVRNMREALPDDIQAAMKGAQ